MTRLEYLTCRVMASDSGREAPPEALAFYRGAGWSENAIESYRARFGRFGNQIHTLPDAFERMSDGMELRINGNIWRVVTGNGHSPEHACLYCPALKVLISGDQVLPRISSNVSVIPTEPNANPMADWLASLAKIRREVPDDVLVLPAHNDCFHGLHARLDYLASSQHRALDELEKTLVSPRRAVDVFTSLFGRPIDESQMAVFGMATGEGIACLNYLVHAGRAVRSTDAEGVAWYHRSA
jgi:glyoxylase-like metal-dependent hydrolase (beta-lactamase superfamily II)